MTGAVVSRRRAGVAWVGVTSLLVGAFSPVLAANPPPTALTPDHRAVEWSGGPLSGTYDSGTCTAPSCDVFKFQTELPRSSGPAPTPGVMVRIHWTDPDQELDLFVLDARGDVVASSNLGGVDSQEVFLSDPPNGAYVVEVESFFAVDLSYTGSASLVQSDGAPAVNAATTMHFSPPAVVDPQITSGEPGLALGPDGRAFIDAPGNGNDTAGLLWRSRGPDDATFDMVNWRPAGVESPLHRPCPQSGGGGDSDLVFDRTGRAYLAGLQDGVVSVSTSTDEGNTWSCGIVSSSRLDDDRPWLAAAPAADGSGPNVDAYLVYRTYNQLGELPVTDTTGKPYVQVDVTRDGGRTWTKQGRFGAGLLRETGAAFVTPSGTFCDAFDGNGATWLAVSDDQGRTFHLHQVSQRNGTPGNSFVTGAADQAGRLYVAWVDSGSFDLFYSYSPDRGSTWSRPTRLNPRNSTAVMPWLAASGPGDVALGWYGTTGSRRADAEPAGQQWYPMVARSTHADLPHATFQLTRMSETPTHTGSVCIRNGGLCDDPDDSLMDFFKIAIGRNGGVVATFADNGRNATAADGGPPEPFVEAVHQTSGLGMSGRLRYPAPAEGGSGASTGHPRQLDFASAPDVVRTKHGIQARMPLNDAADLTGALAGAGPGVATDAWWLVVWKRPGAVQYAGMHIERTGALQFFGGNDPVPAPAPGISFTSYPSTFSLAGSVDARSGTVTIDLPDRSYGLHPGDRFFSVQGFSMTGVSTPAQFQPMELVDSTAPRDALP